MNICRLGSTGLYPLIPQLTMCETKNLEKRVRRNIDFLMWFLSIVSIGKYL